MNAALSALIDEFSRTLSPEQLRDLGTKLDTTQENLLHKILVQPARSPSAHHQALRADARLLRLCDVRDVTHPPFF